MNIRLIGIHIVNNCQLLYNINYIGGQFMQDKELQFYNIVLCAVVGGLINRAYKGNIFISIILIIAVLLFLFKVVKVEKYMKKYLIK